MTAVTQATQTTQATRRWVIDRFGREHLRMETVRLAPPGPGQVGVRVRAVALNARDDLMLTDGMGVPVAFPFVPASDLSGVVEAVGPGVTDLTPGDRVISVFLPDWHDGRPAGTGAEPAYRSLGGYYPGVMADRVVVPAHWLLPAPATLDHAAASTLPVAGLTAWFALVERGHIRAGQTVLVQGTGGVSLFGLQLARAAGADVIVTSASDEKLARAKALGATHLVNRRSTDWADEALRLTGGRGADHILEVVGGDNFGRSVRAVAVAGRISVIGLLAGTDLAGPTTPLLLKMPTVQGIATGHRLALADLVRAVDRLGLRPVIDRTYPFADFPAALDHLRRGAFGKVVVADPS